MGFFMKSKMAIENILANSNELLQIITKQVNTTIKGILLSVCCNYPSHPIDSFVEKFISHKIC